MEGEGVERPLGLKINGFFILVLWRPFVHSKATESEKIRKFLNWTVIYFTVCEEAKEKYNYVLHTSGNGPQLTEWVNKGTSPQLPLEKAKGKEDKIPGLAVTTETVQILTQN